MSKIKTKFETSSGGLVYKIENSKMKVALISWKREGGEKIWCLPKGLVKEDEDRKDTALREIKEETGVTGEIEDKLGTIDYWFYLKEEKIKCHKSVHFYLVKYLSGNLSDHDWEVEDAKWFQIEKAIDILSFENEKKIVKKAFKKLTERLKL